MTTTLPLPMGLALAWVLLAAVLVGIWAAEGALAQGDEVGRDKTRAALQKAQIAINNQTLPFCFGGHSGKFTCV
jgi:hypothetical protein